MCRSTSELQLKNKKEAKRRRRETQSPRIFRRTFTLYNNKQSVYMLLPLPSYGIAYYTTIVYFGRKVQEKQTTPQNGKNGKICA